MLQQCAYMYRETNLIDHPFPVGYIDGMSKFWAGVNVIGYASMLHTVQWAGRTLSLGIYGILTSRIAGLFRIFVCSVALFKEKDKVLQYTFIAHIVRGVCEIVGLAPLLLIMDIVVTVLVSSLTDI